MKAYLYAVIRESACSWHVSLDLRADRQHYLSLYGPCFKLRVLEPALSFGQAMELQKRFSREGNTVVTSKRIRALGPGVLGVGPGSTQEWVIREWKPGAEHEAYANEVDDGKRIRYMAMMLRGRQLLIDEVVALLENGSEESKTDTTLLYDLQRAWLAGFVEIDQGVSVSKQGFLFREQRYQCSRCGTNAKKKRNDGGVNSIRWSACPHCQQDCAYCEACLTMGRARFCSIVVSGVSRSPEVKEDTQELSDYTSPWGLSSIQEEAAGEALRFLKANIFLSPAKEEEPRKFLIWAVTGAGKTEMIFPMISYALARGGKVAVATPRRDVVLELMPRIRKAFPDAAVVTLYGGSEQRWEQGEITIATTHQLMRFRHAFDLVIIDEIDAFPYHNNPMLLYAAAKVCKPWGVNLLLSATPPAPLRKLAARGKLPHVKVAARYHRQPLPEPTVERSLALRTIIQQGNAPAALIGKLKKSLDRGAQLFVFVPNISMVEPLLKLLRKALPDIRVEGTSSKDADRGEKVLAFRAREIRLLITTTILERGVTIPQSDVFILDADSPVFDSAAMVQMAGRAGRSAQDPNGFVYFYSKEKTRSQAEAIQQIKSMNRLARKKGLLLPKS